MESVAMAATSFSVATPHEKVGPALESHFSERLDITAQVKEMLK